MEFCQSVSRILYLKNIFSVCVCIQTFWKQSVTLKFITTEIFVPRERQTLWHIYFWSFRNINLLIFGILKKRGENYKMKYDLSLCALKEGTWRMLHFRNNKFQCDRSVIENTIFLYVSKIKKDDLSETLYLGS